MGQNITIMNANYTDVPAVELPKTGGGSALFYEAPCIVGEFTTDNITTGGVQSINIPYTGNGYIIGLYVFIKGGMYNNTSSGNTSWYNATGVQYAVGQYTITKSETTSTPTYTTSGSNNYGCIVTIYKASSTNATSYSRQINVSANSYSSNEPSNTSGATVKL